MRRSPDTGQPPAAAPGRVRRLLWFLEKELRLVVPPTIFFAVSFNLIVFSTNLILSQYLVQLGGFVVATTMALVVGKAVLVADELPFLRRFDTAPLVQPILFKTAVYWAVVFVVRLLESFVRYVVESGGVEGYGGFMVEHFTWHRFLFVQIWILVLFLVYTTASELNALFGDGELFHILFRRRSTDLKLTRRQRIRALVQVGRLTRAHSIEELGNPQSRGHRQLVEQIAALARDDHQATRAPASGNPNR